MGTPGEPGRRGGRWVAALAVVPFLIGVGACGGGDGGSAGAESPTTEAAADAATTASVDPSSRPCSTERHMVVFDFFGSLVGGTPDLGAWVGGDVDLSGPRSGAPEVASAYRDRGYEVMYLTLVPTALMVGDTPVVDAVSAWLAQHGFPTGAGTQVWAWDGQGSTPVVRAIDELVRLSTQDVSVDAAYTDNLDKANALVTGGVPSDRLFTLGTAAGEIGSTSIPEDDYVAHLAAVQALPAVCQPG